MRWIALSLALALTPVMAAAENRRGVAGEWIFEAPLEGAPECVIEGRASITRMRARQEYQVRVAGLETCENGQTWQMEQDCVGTLQNRRFTIECTLVSATPGNYMRDNFSLVVMHDDLMIGTLLSSRTGASTWRRAPAPLVS